jgi:hypothetical protein
MFLFRYVVFGTLYMYLYLNVFIQVRCVWYFIHVLISQCLYSGTLCLVLYTCTYISMFLFRYIVFGTLYMYLYLNVFIQVRCVWYFIHVLISQCFYSGTLCLVIYTCTYILMFYLSEQKINYFPISSIAYSSPKLLKWYQNF